MLNGLCPGQSPVTAEVYPKENRFAIALRVQFASEHLLIPGIRKQKSPEFGALGTVSRLL